MSQASDTLIALKGILHPEVLKRVHALAVPPAGITPKDLFAGNPLHPEAKSQLEQLLLQSVFVPLSKISLSAYPDNMLHLLPPPDNKDFPVLATGLVVLLDQATRITLEGVNVRWVNSFFDDLACRIAKQLCDLPTELRIDDPPRWVDLDQGYSWEDGMIRAQFLHVPFVHSEDETSQRYATDLCESRRVTVEARYDKRDPARTDHRAALENDLDGFPRLLRGGSPPPYYTNADFPDFSGLDARSIAPIYLLYKNLDGTHGETRL